jgi:hypothetical protein
MLSGLKVGDLEAADGRAFTDCIGQTTQTNSGHQQLQRLGLTDSADDACAGARGEGRPVAVAHRRRQSALTASRGIPLPLPVMFIAVFIACRAARRRFLPTLSNCSMLG